MYPAKHCKIKLFSYKYFTLKQTERNLSKNIMLFLCLMPIMHQCMYLDLVKLEMVPLPLIQTQRKLPELA